MRNYSRVSLRGTLVRWLLLLVIIVILVACNPLQRSGDQPSIDGQLSGRLLLWHDWQGGSVQTLSRLIDRFREVNPGVTIISIAMPTEELVASVKDFASGGLGPDIVLTDAGNIDELADAWLLRNLAGRSDVDTERFLPGPLSTVQSGSLLYGLPFTLHTQVLFYNRARVMQAPQTLDALLDAVDGGKTIGISTELVDAFWGVGAFSGSLFDAEGNLALNEGGFLNWVDFLKSLQSVPGVVLDKKYEPLRARFEAGELDFLVGTSLDMLRLQGVIGVQELGIAALPSGPNERAAGPILHVDAFGFSRAASAEETKLALAVVNFLTNTQQQSRLLAEPTGRLPVLNQVRYRRNLPDFVNQLGRQSRTAIPIPMQRMDMWKTLSDLTSEVRAIYTQALAGTISSQPAVATITQLLADQFHLTVRTSSNEQFCPDTSETDVLRTTELLLWHTLEGTEADAMQRIGNAYEQICLGVRIQIEQVNQERVVAIYRRALEEGEGPDMLLESTRITAQLADDQLIRDLSDMVESDFLQRFIPGSAEAMRIGGRLYALPESVEVLALYRNFELAPEPLFDLEEIPLRTAGDRSFAMPASFFYGYWGIAPFGDFEFDPVSGALLKVEGLRKWLVWLRSQQGQPGIALDLEWKTSEDRFANGNAAYLVSGPWSLVRLREEMGHDRIRVAPLPAGSRGPGSPILQVRGLMVNSKITDAQAAVALAFGRFLTSTANQTILLNTGVHVSALVNIALGDYPLLNGFREQAKAATVVTENARFATIEREADILYRDVLLEGMAIDEAMAAFVERVDVANGFVSEGDE
ncbi:MAG: extracellular solute-binding protein [Caldilineaceae bacterium]|nr:extracellular solute-binding protein [Caldilineaceae bacterium]